MRKALLPVTAADGSGSGDCLRNRAEPFFLLQLVKRWPLMALAHQRPAWCCCAASAPGRELYQSQHHCMLQLADAQDTRYSLRNHDHPGSR